MRVDFAADEERSIDPRVALKDGEVADVLHHIVGHRLLLDGPDSLDSIEAALRDVLADRFTTIFLVERAADFAQFLDNTIAPRCRICRFNVKKLDNKGIIKRRSNPIDHVVGHDLLLEVLIENVMVRGAVQNRRFDGLVEGIFEILDYQCRLGFPGHLNHSAQTLRYTDAVLLDSAHRLRKFFLHVIEQTRHRRLPPRNDLFHGTQIDLLALKERALECIGLHEGLEPGFSQLLSSIVDGLLKLFHRGGDCDLKARRRLRQRPLALPEHRERSERIRSHLAQFAFFFRESRARR
mmetsp:Transcript_682/g.2157  ORF Transcript_682/g.2157 Transcript_682/m.2157 type:complete len:294 (+) Transcript_682:362-1243(+)